MALRTIKTNLQRNPAESRDAVGGAVRRWYAAAAHPAARSRTGTTPPRYHRRPRCARDIALRPIKTKKPICRNHSANEEPLTRRAVLARQESARPAAAVRRKDDVRLLGTPVPGGAGAHPPEPHAGVRALCSSPRPERRRHGARVPFPALQLPFQLLPARRRQPGRTSPPGFVSVMPHSSAISPRRSLRCSAG